jgi:hypothetical protein
VANATDIVKKGYVRHADEFYRRDLATLASATRFYPLAGIGLTTDGYAAKFDDTASLVFDGVVRGQEGNVLMAAATAGDAGHWINVIKPLYLELALTSVAKSSIGKTVYALFDNEGTLDPSATTYANVWGKVVDVAATNIALVELAYGGALANPGLSAAKQLAATGTITLTKFDLGKTIIITNTGAQTINLPAVASCPSGSWIRFVKKSTNAAAATLDGADSEEIDSATTYAAIDAEHDCALLVSDGTQWHIASRDIA